MRLRLALVLCTLSVAAMTAQTSDMRTRAEITNYEETSTYADVTRVIDGLVATSKLVHTESFGKTEEGRDLPLMVISDPKVTTPAAARKLGRPLVFVQANIHAGEVEGKEAVLMLARRLVSGDLKPLTRQLVLLIAPDYNADGNEKVNVMNRTAQNGPVAGVGTRENSKGLDLNRDYMKLDSAEARSLVGLFNKWDPHVIVDLHTTNGSYHANHLTYSPILNPNADARLIEFTRERMLAPIRQAMLKTHNWRTYYYGNFAPEDGGGRESSRVDPANPGNVTWRTFDHRPRYGNNYAGLRNRIAILSEAYSYLDFKGRIEVTEDFVEEIWKSAAAQRQADHDAHRAGRPRVHRAGEREAGGAWRRHRDPRAARARRDHGRRRDQGAEPALRPRHAGDGAGGDAGADEGLRRLRRHALAADAEGLVDSEDDWRSRRVSPPLSIACAGTACRSRRSPTTCSWPSSGSRSAR